jgi:hypothetical protein
MTEDTNARLLKLAAGRAARRPGFVAFDLARFEEVAGKPAAWLRIGREQVDALALCRTPRRGVHFGHDLIAIASHVGIEPRRLASLLRLVDVLPELQARAGALAADDRPAALLAAARDETDDHTVLSQTPVAGPGLPGWLHDAVERFWSEAPALRSYPRDLDFAVLVGLPLAVIELPELSVRSIAQWLTAHKVELMLSGPNRRLRACLVALGGVGLVFVDAGDDPTQRRVSLAHEAGHFIVEYLIPRDEVARRRPELLSVLDGEREPTPKERLSAILSDVPVGVHTHLLDRAESDATGLHEWRARRIALELLAPEGEVRSRARQQGVKSADALRELLVDDFGLPVALASDYADQLADPVGRDDYGLLDLLGRRSATDGPNQSSGRTSDWGPEGDR